MSELELENKVLKEKIETLEQRVKELEEKNASYVDLLSLYHKIKKSAEPESNQRPEDIF